MNAYASSSNGYQKCHSSGLYAAYRIETSANKHTAKKICCQKMCGTHKLHDQMTRISSSSSIYNVFCGQHNNQLAVVLQMK